MSVVAYYCSKSLDMSESLSTLLIWFAMPCLVEFYIISKIIEPVAYFGLMLSKLLQMDLDGAADALDRWLDEE